MNKNILVQDSSKRKIDNDNGFLIIDDCILTEEGIQNYSGSEIPFLGLDPNKIYKVYRPAQVLKNNVNAFNNLPITVEHVPIDPNNLQNDRIIGVAGEKSKIYTDPDTGKCQILNNIVLYDSDVIKAVQNGTLKHLSCGYHWDVEKSTNPDYDLIITSIRGNHVAIVDNPRIKNAIISDSESKKGEMNMKNIWKKKITHDSDQVKDDMGEVLLKLENFLKENGLDDKIEFEVKESVYDEDKKKDERDEALGAEYSDLNRGDKYRDDKPVKDSMTKDNTSKESITKDDIEDMIFSKLEDLKKDLLDIVKKENTLLDEAIEDAEKVLGDEIDKKMATDADTVYNKVLEAKGINLSNMSFDSKKGLVKGLSYSNSYKQSESNIVMDSSSNDYSSLENILSELLNR